MSDGPTYTSGEDGVGVEWGDEVHFYSEYTDCARCSEKSDGVMVPKTDEVPKVRMKGVPLCEDCESVSGKMDNKTDYDFVEYE